MPTSLPAYFPGAPPGADPFFGLELAFADAIARRVPGYTLGTYGSGFDPPAPMPSVVALTAPRARFVSRIRTRPR